MYSNVSLVADKQTFQYRYVRVYDKLQLQPEYEINPDELQLVTKVGEGEFGTVHKGKWNKTTVAIKTLRRSDAVALGDFRQAFKEHTGFKS